MNSRISLLLIVCLTTIISACGPNNSVTTTRPDSSAVIAAEQAEQSGDHLGAGQQYLELALTDNKQQQAQFYLRAAQAFWTADHLENAVTSIEKVDFEQLSTAQQHDAAILKAKIQLNNTQAEEALASLSPYDLNTMPDEQKRSMLELKIEAYSFTENWLEKANSHILLAPLLADYSREENQQLLWQALMKLEPQILDLFNPGSPPSIDSGWFALAYAIKAYQSNPEAMTVALEDWQRSYPYHPASSELYQSSIVTGTNLPQTLTDIAVLLPESGPYKAAAAAIKEGIIAAHLTAQSNARLHFFAVNSDKQSDTSNVVQQYLRAVDQHVSLVIGPLDKVAVQHLAELDSLPTPVLALNKLTVQQTKTNLFQFGLAPEDDAVATANFAASQGFERAVILSPDNAWGDRIAAAFSEQWQSNGGVLLNHARYDLSQHDFSETLKPFLGLSSSLQRSQSLKRTLGRALEFEPRRRQDIDFLFLIAKPQKARQLVPQLKFYRSGTLPILATSHVYTGTANAQQDIDLNRVLINDVPWMFAELSQSDPTYSALSSNNPMSFDRLVRLYALGNDAYHLTTELNTLSRDPQTSYSGATGELSIDDQGKINRETSWGQFKAGLLEPLLKNNE